MFTPASLIERYMEDKIFRFHKTKKDDPIMAATNLFRKIINIHPFEDGNGRICHLILTHVLKQMKCCLFPVILSSFHRHGRRHYVRAVKRYKENPSMLYTMILKSLIHCQDNFEQNAKILTHPLSIDTCLGTNDDLARVWNLIKMSSLLNVSNDASRKSEEFSLKDTEVFVDSEEKKWFKWAHVGKFLGIENIQTSLNGLEKR